MNQRQGLGFAAKVSFPTGNKTRLFLPLKVVRKLKIPYEGNELLVDRTTLVKCL